MKMKINERLAIFFLLIIDPLIEGRVFSLFEASDVFLNHLLY